jgi:hypothetical protein
VIEASDLLCISGSSLTVVVVVDLVLEPQDQRLELSQFSWCFCGGLLISPARCSIKCVRGSKKSLV